MVSSTSLGPGARDERDVNDEMVDENEYGYPNENANENGNDGSTDSNNDDDDDTDDEKINQRVNSHNKMFLNVSKYKKRREKK